MNSVSEENQESTPLAKPSKVTNENRGKGLHHLGKGKHASKRHQHFLRDNIHGITRPSIRRLARRAGIKHVSGLLYSEARATMRGFMTAILRDALAYTEHSMRKTLTTSDIIHALQRQGQTLYGFGN